MINIENLENEIKEWEDQISLLESKMNEIRGKMILALQVFLQDYFKSTIEKEVRTKTDVTKSLGKDKLSQLKSELNDLIEKTPDLVQEYFDKELVWVYAPSYSIKGKDSFNLKFDMDRKIPDDIKLAIRTLLGFTGKIIITYGFEKINETWERQGNSNTLKYRYGVSIPDNLQIIIREFVTFFDAFHDAHVKVEKLKRQKEEQEAINLWDQA